MRDLQKGNNMISEWKIRFVERPEIDGRYLYICRTSHDDRFEVMMSDGKTMVYDRGVETKPTLFLSRDMFQAIVDAVHKDFKPSEGKFTEGKLEATERHLADLRQLLKLE